MKFTKQNLIYSTSRAQVPVVDVMNDKWRIYFSDRNEHGYSVPHYIDVEPGNPDKIITVKSKQLLETGPLGSFDYAGVMPTSVITTPGSDRGRYMYYIGWTNRKDVPYHNTIGLAISHDEGDSWSKLYKGPIFGTSRHEPGYTGTICVMPGDTEWQAWYLSCREWVKINNRIEPKYTINYAVSLNGIDWIPRGIAIDLENDEGGISQASVIQDNDKYIMYFSVRDTSNYRKGGPGAYRIEYAESSDGEVWERKGVCLERSKTGWDSEMVSYPNVLDYQNQRYIFYNGNNFGQTGIGYAIMPLQNG